MDPNEIWFTMLSAIEELIDSAGIRAEEIAGIGIASQRETTVIWDRQSGEPVYNAIQWQDRRTSKLCDEFRYQGFTGMIRQKTGLILDAYFSASKISWILDHVRDGRIRAEQGRLAFGTIDAWLVWKLTAGKTHVTDVTNASRTMLFNIHSLQWDEELLRLFNIPHQLLPGICSNRRDHRAYRRLPSLKQLFPLPRWQATSRRRSLARCAWSRAWSRIPTAADVSR